MNKAFNVVNNKDKIVVKGITDKAFCFLLKEKTNIFDSEEQLISKFEQFCDTCSYQECVDLIREADEELKLLYAYVCERKENRNIYLKHTLLNTYCVFTKEFKPIGTVIDPEIEPLLAYDKPGIKLIERTNDNEYIDVAVLTAPNIGYLAGCIQMRNDTLWFYPLGSNGRKKVEENSPLMKMYKKLRDQSYDWLCANIEGVDDNHYL